MIDGRYVVVVVMVVVVILLVVVGSVSKSHGCKSSTKATSIVQALVLYCTS